MEIANTIRRKLAGKLSQISVMEKREVKYERFYTIFIWVIVVGFTCLYLSLIFNHNIWTDEAFTLQLLKGNIHEIIEGTAKDVHPPLYYLYAKLFMVFFGESFLAQKIAVIIPMIVLLVVGATIVRNTFGNRASLMFLLFITCIPCTMEFSVQLRMYSMALLFVTLCGIYAFLTFESGKKSDVVMFSLNGILAAYTHYFAFVSVIFITVLLLFAFLVWKREKVYTWLISVLVMVICYLPWLPYFLKQVIRVEQGYWIPEITAQTVWEYFVWTFDLELIPGVVFIFLLVLKWISIFSVIQIDKHKNKTDIYALLCMLVPMFTTIFGVIASEIRMPIYRDQYILPALGMLALFFGITMNKMRKEIVVFITMFLLFVGAVQYRECYRQEYHSTYVAQTEDFFINNLKEEDYIIYNWEAFGFIYECYFDAERLAYVDNFDFSEDYHAIWFLCTPHEKEIPQETIENNGLIMENMGHYGIEHNEFDIYKIYRNYL